LLFECQWNLSFENRAKEKEVRMVFELDGFVDKFGRARQAYGNHIVLVQNIIVRTKCEALFPKKNCSEFNIGYGQ
jgi:hypothetical protein